MEDTSDTTDAAARLRPHMVGTLCERMGMTLDSLSSEGGVMRMPMEGNTQPMGLLHGGATIALAETIGSFAAMVRALEVHGDGAVAVGTSVAATHHRSGCRGQATATCRPLHLGRSVCSYLVDVEDDDGRLLSTVTVSTMLLPPRD
jgi:1,4-dihydroxy-2-naphthoyl-CoA hydrolase